MASSSLLLAQILFAVLKTPARKRQQGQHDRHGPTRVPAPKLKKFLRVRHQLRLADFSRRRELPGSHRLKPYRFTSSIFVTIFNLRRPWGCFHPSRRPNELRGATLPPAMGGVCSVRRDDEGARSSVDDRGTVLHHQLRAPGHLSLHLSGRRLCQILVPLLFKIRCGTACLILEL